MTADPRQQARDAYEYWSGFGVPLNDHPVVRGRAAQLGICPMSRRPTDEEVFLVFVAAHGKVGAA